MAYISKAEAAIIRNELKVAFPEIKFSVTVANNSVLNVAIMSAPKNFFETKASCTVTSIITTSIAATNCRTKKH